MYCNATSTEERKRDVLVYENIIQDNMIERISEKKGNYLPCKEVIAFLEMLKAKNTNLKVMEIGVDIGATAVEIIKRLGKGDEYYYFDEKSKIEELKCDFATLNSSASLLGMGNTIKYGDSYAWNLAKLAAEGLGDIDLVYMDGAHTFLHDSSSTAVIKEMMKKGGIIVFDDVNWSIEKSPTVNPSKAPWIVEMYTEEQISECHIDLLIRTIMDTDERFERIESIQVGRAAYRRK